MITGYVSGEIVGCGYVQPVTGRIAYALPVRRKAAESYIGFVLCLRSRKRAGCWSGRWCRRECCCCCCCRCERRCGCRCRCKCSCSCSRASGCSCCCRGGRGCGCRRRFGAGVSDFQTVRKCGSATGEDRGRTRATSLHSARCAGAIVTSNSINDVKEIRHVLIENDFEVSRGKGFISEQRATFKGKLPV